MAERQVGAGRMAEPDEDLAPSDHLTPDERDPEAPEADAEAYQH